MHVLYMKCCALNICFNRKSAPQCRSWSSSAFCSQPVGSAPEEHDHARTMRSACPWLSVITRHPTAAELSYWGFFKMRPCLKS